MNHSVRNINFTLHSIVAILLLFLIINLSAAVTDISVPRCKQPKYTNCTLMHRTMELWCDHTNLTAIPIPKNLVGEFLAPPEKSSIIIFRQSCVESIDKDALVYYSWVMVLDLSGNLIEVLQVKTFPNLENLRKLLLNNNRLNRIDDNAFIGLTGLQDLQMDYNEIDSISDSTFAGLPHLVNLTLSNNKLSTLSTAAFQKLTHLKMLDLSGNQLKKFLPHHLVGLANFESLNLNGNQLKSFDSHIYLAANNITKLYLNNNSIRCFDIEAFDKKGLKVLEIANNPLKRPYKQWFNQFFMKTSKDSTEFSILMSKSGSWICDCKVYSYYRFLWDSLDENWREKLDVECNKPLNLQGKMLSQLDWKQLSFHGNCSTPDRYVPCPNDEPHTPFTTTTTIATSTTTTTATTEEPLPEPKPERLRVSNQDHIPLLPPKNEQVPENNFHIYLLIALAGLAVGFVSIGCVCLVLNRQRATAENKRNKASWKSSDVLSSRTDSLIDFQENEEVFTSSNQRPATSKCNAASFQIQSEANSGNLCEIGAKHVKGSTAEASVSDNATNTHQHDILKRESVEPSLQPNSPHQNSQKDMRPTSSSGGSTKLQPTVQITLQVSSSPQDPNQFRIVPDYLNTTPVNW